MGKTARTPQDFWNIVLVLIYKKINALLLWGKKRMAVGIILPLESLGCIKRLSGYPRSFRLP